MSQYGMPNQMPMQQMPQYGQHMPGNPQMPMMPTGMPTAERINALSQQMMQLDEQRKALQQQIYSGQSQQQMQQPVPMQPQQSTNMVALIPVASYQDMQNYDVDITGKTQWFYNESTDEVYTKRLDIKAKQPQTIFKVAKLAAVPDDYEPTADKQPDPEPNKPDEIDALKRQLAALEKEVKAIKENSNAKPAASNSDDTAAAKSGDEPKAANRQRATTKPGAKE